MCFHLYLSKMDICSWSGNLTCHAILSVHLWVSGTHLFIEHTMRTALSGKDVVDDC